VRIVLRLLGFLRPFLGWVGLSILLGSAAVLSAIGLMGTSAYLLSQAALHPSIAALQVAIVGVRFFGINRGIFRYLERLTSHEVNFRLLSHLRTWFYRALEPLAPARLLSQRSGDLLTRSIADIDTLEDFYVRAVAPPAIACVIMGGMAFFIRQFDPSLVGLLLCGLLAQGIGVTYLIYRIGQGPGRQLVGERAKLNALLVEDIQGMTDLLAFNRESASLEQVNQLGKTLERSRVQYAWGTGWSAALGLLATNLTLWFVLFLAIPLVNLSKLNGVMLAVLSLVTLASFEAVFPLGEAALRLGSCQQAAQRLFDVVDAKPQVLLPKDPLPPPESMVLSIRNLTFRYQPELPPALDQVNLELPEGHWIAIVGPSGAGKTTLTNLVLRFWEIPNGMIFLDGRDIREYAPQDIRQRAGVVTQTTSLFNGTVRYNLHLANPKADDGELVDAISHAGLQNWFSELPEGLDSWVGEGGLRMSGGERQRLAIARALLVDAPLWLLDEPAAQLDSITSARLMETLTQVLKDRSVLWLTHRLSGMERMDEIIVLQEGRIVERGDHLYLTAAGGLYARMWNLQNRILLPPVGTSPGMKAS